MADSDERSIESVSREARKFPPPSEFSEQAHLSSLDQYERLYARAAADPDGFWGEIAGELAWSRPWEKVQMGEFPYAKWFVGGELNVTVSCLDRHLTTWR